MVLKPSVEYPLISSRFENDVKMYGTQTSMFSISSSSSFENDVKMYGTQTVLYAENVIARLRMM